MAIRALLLDGTNDLKVCLGDESTRFELRYWFFADYRQHYKARKRKVDDDDEDIWKAAPKLATCMHRSEPAQIISNSTSNPRKHIEQFVANLHLFFQLVLST